jgi:hypothetical protein|tara:strand:+ start:360 stop:758 length:399 start_codon:yes stop_codon:yes gene_type:complete
MSNKTCVLKFKKINGKLTPIDKLMHLRFKEYIQNLSDNDEVECILEGVNPNNTKAQLAKIHVMIKEIADETGATVKHTKLHVKDECGLTYYDDKEKKYKSFADQSRLELSKVIDRMYELGSFLNINFQKDLL